MSDERNNLSQDEIYNNDKFSIRNGIKKQVMYVTQNYDKLKQTQDASSNNKKPHQEKLIN